MKSWFKKWKFLNFCCFFFKKNYTLVKKGYKIPGAPLTNFNNGGGGGVWQRFKFYTQKKSQLQNLSTQKNQVLLFLAYPKKSRSPFFTTHKNLFFSRPQKILASFYLDPKIHFWSKFQTPKNHSTPLPPPTVIKKMWVGIQILTFRWC